MTKCGNHGDGLVYYADRSRMFNRKMVREAEILA